MATRRPVPPEQLQQLQRFLYVGLDENKYFPGSWISHKYFELDRLAVLDSILEADPICQEVCDIILKTYKDGLYTRFDTIAFAICKCLLRGNEAMKNKMYKLVEEVCQTPLELFTFVSYTRKFKTGHGNGWCRTVGNWYRSKEPMQLAADVCRVKGHRNQKHSIIVRKSHTKIEEGDHARDSIIKYLMYGLKQARLIHQEHPEAAPTLAYICSVEELRHCEDPRAAARIIRDNNFVIDHIPGHLLTSQEVWEAALPNLTLQRLLSVLLRLHNMAFLAAESTTTSIVESLLTNTDYVTKSKVTPLEVFIALQSYTQKKVPMKNPKLKFLAARKQRRREKQHLDPDTQLWVWDTEKPRHPKEQKYWGIDTPYSPVVESALLKTLQLSWPRPAADSTVRYLITMDLRDHMFKGRHFCTTSFKAPKKEPSPPKNAPQRERKSTAKLPEVTAPAAPASSEPAKADKTKRGNKKPLAECFHHDCVTPGDAAILTALYLYKREKDVTIAVFTETGVKTVDLGRDRRALTLDKAKHKLMKMNLGRVKVDAPIVWANRTNTPIDVFVNMIDRQSRFMELDPADCTGRGSGGGYGPAPPLDSADHCPVRALDCYRQQRNMPHSRLITMSLATHKVRTSDTSFTRGVLDIVGIDEHVPRVMDAFAAGLFE